MTENETRKTNNIFCTPIGPILQKIDWAIKETPFAGDVHLVGGSVRNFLLGLDIKDIDLVTTKSASDLAHLLYDKGISSIHPVTFPVFGTAMVQVGQYQVEIVTSRTERYEPHSRKPHVSQASLLEDLERRDFTINTLIVDISTGLIKDLLGVGERDLFLRTISTPKDPIVTFSDDPLRLLRAIRFSCQLNFQLDEETLCALIATAPRLGSISKERVQEELNKVLILPNGANAIKDMEEFHLLEHIIPELLPLKGLEQTKKYWQEDGWEHTLKVLSNVVKEKDLVLSLAALFHDIGKPSTYQLSNGQATFLKHEYAGAKITRKVLNRLRYSNDIISSVCKLVDNHMRISTRIEPTEKFARRLIRDLGEDLYRLILLAKADRGAKSTSPNNQSIQAVYDVIEAIRQKEKSALFVSPLGGEEIALQLNILPGKELGLYKNLLTEMVIQGTIPIGDKDKASTELQLIFSGHYGNPQSYLSSLLES